MTHTDQDKAAAVRHYLETGEYEMLFPAWTGASIVDRLSRGYRDLQEALVIDVQRRARSGDMPRAAQEIDLVEFTRKKAAPMVCGLFPKSEHDIALSLLERSVIFLTPNTIKSIIMASNWLSTAWTVANMYLMSLNAEPLSQDAPMIVGLSEETTCFVSLAYFDEEEPFADFVVHEMAHVFHNCKRRTAGLKQTRTREWFLNIDYRKRETFAYACEAYSRILEQAATPSDRRALAKKFDGFERASEDCIDSDEVAELVREACARRNGWKSILSNCAPKLRT